MRQTNHTLAEKEEHDARELTFRMMRLALSNHPIAQNENEHVKECRRDVKGLRELLHNVVDKECNGLLERCVECSNTRVFGKCDGRGCIHEGVPRIRLNNRNLRLAEWGIRNAARTTFGTGLLDLCEPLLLDVFRMVNDDRRPLLKTTTYTRDSSGCVIPNVRQACTRTGRHRHISARLLGLYGTCSLFKRLLDKTYLK